MSGAADNDTAAAWQFAVRFLKRRDRSEAQVRDELTARAIAAADVEATIERLRQHRYVDDARFASELAERLARRGHGSVRARRDLEQAGIGEELLAEVVERVFAEESRTAQRLLEARYAQPLSPTDRARAGRFLIGRGFPEHLVQQIVGDDE